jgi:hypothetical protein
MIKTRVNGFPKISLQALLAYWFVLEKGAA